MKFLVVTVALLVHQVLGDASTELVTRASNEFANKFYEVVAKQPGNVLICPISLHVALAVIHQGADGNTAAELATGLNLRGTNDNIKDGYKALLTAIFKEKTGPLKMATKVYTPANFQVNKDFENNAITNFLSEIENVDFSNSALAANKINKYVEEKTNNKIHDLISPDAITALTRMVLINAVHFQAEWKKTFPRSYDDFFKVSRTEKVKTKMMSQTDYFAYKEDPVLDAKVLKMDYSSGGYSMVFVLPNKEDGLTTMEAKLVHTPLENLLKDMRETKVDVTIPKFKLEQTLNLVDTLKQMGIREIFSDRADLSKLSNGENLHVSNVIQKTYINVHENGTEAAAATVFLETLSANTDDDPVFFARRPFHYYLLRDKSPQMVLFEGRFVRPQDGDFPVPINPSEQSDKTGKINFVEDPNEDKNKFTNNGQEITNQNQGLNNNVVSGSQNVRPGSQNVRLGSQNVQPGSQNVRPGSQNVQPGSHNVQPGSQNVQPGSQNVQPGSQNVQPGNQNVRPGSQNVLPGYTQNSPQNTNYNAQQPGQINQELQPDYNDRFAFPSTVRPQPQPVQSFPGQYYQQPIQQQSFQQQPNQQQSFQPQMFQQQPYQQQTYQQQLQQYYQQSSGQQSHQYYQQQQVYRRRVQGTQ